MEKDLVLKIRSIAIRKERVGEDDIRSMMSLIRKLLDKMSQSEQNRFLILRLFCNWALHIEITQSNTGLRILAEINDAMVSIKNSTDPLKIRIKISNSIGFPILRKEMEEFFQKYKIEKSLVLMNNVWAIFVDNLIEIIRDVPLSFPSLSTLNQKQQKIYNKIASNPIKIGAGVVSARISLIKYPLPDNLIMCLLVKTEDTTTFVIPLLVDVRK